LSFRFSLSVLRFLLVAQVDLRCRNSPVQLLTLRSRFCHCRCTFLGTGLGAGIWPRQSRFLLDLGHAPGRVAPSILPLGIFVLSPEELRLPRRLRKGSSNPYCSSVLLLNCGLSWEQVFGFGFLSASLCAARRFSLFPFRFSSCDVRVDCSFLPSVLLLSRRRKSLEFL
jgi:hypothetical protein